MNHFERQRGSVLLYAMLSMSVMLAIGLTLNELFLAKLRSISAARDSITALYAADSASEMCLYDARKNAADELVMDNGAAFQVASASLDATDVTANCASLGTAGFGFRSTGTYHGVRRTLEISQ